MIEHFAMWSLVILCLWVVHQTASTRRSLGSFFMRLGIAMLGFGGVVAEVSNFTETNPSLALLFLVVSIDIMLFGVILFHKKRFGLL